MHQVPTRPIIGINFPFEDASWLGGSHSILHVLKCFQRLPEPRMRLCLVAPVSIAAEVESLLPSIRILRTSLQTAGSPAHFARRVVRKSTGRDLLMERWLRTRGIRLFSHADPLGRGARIPVMGYIPDLSFHHLPHLYNPDAVAVQQRYVRRVADGVETLLLMSHAVEEDFALIYGATKAKRAVLHVVPEVPPRDLVLERAIVAEHRLLERIFFLPNKFWVHKNHRVVVEALGLLREQGTPVQVVCSGMTTDERQPDHFAELMRRVGELGITDQFRVLGVLPYDHVMALMRASIAVLSPSKSEGWGLSISEARQMGKAVVLSDIPVFREQAPAQARFFAPDDVQGLAAILSELHSTFDPERDRAAQMAAETNAVAHQQECARGFEDIVLETLRRFS